MVDFFGAIVPEHDITHQDRRVGGSIGDAFHQAVWQLNRVSICTTTGVVVRYSCDRCEARLTWTNMVDLLTCPRCLKTVNHEAEPVPEPLQSGALCLASLLDPRALVHAPAVAAVNAALQSESRGTLFYLGYHLGVAMSPVRTLGGLGRGQKLPVLDGLSALAAGARLLAQWPDAIGEALRDKDEAKRCAAAIRAIATTGPGSADHHRLLSDAFPKLHGTSQGWLASLMPDTLENGEAAKFVGLHESSFSKVALSRSVPTVMETKGGKLRGLFARRDLLPLRDTVEHQMSMPTAANLLRIPVCSVGQLGCMGEVTLMTHSALGVLYDTPRADGRSVLALIARIETEAGRSLETGDEFELIPLRKASMVVGGRQKPWGRCSPRSPGAGTDTSWAVPPRAASSIASPFRASRGRPCSAPPSIAWPTGVLRSKRPRAGATPANSSTSRRSRHSRCLNCLTRSTHGRGHVGITLEVANEILSHRELQARWGVNHHACQQLVAYLDLAIPFLNERCIEAAKVFPAGWFAVPLQEDMHPTDG